MRTAQKITQLKEGTAYKFRIRAVNKFGVSDALESDIVEPKHPFVVPDAPGKPQVDDITKDSAKLSWKAPRKDGGSPITG